VSDDEGGLLIFISGICFGAIIGGGVVGCERTLHWCGQAIEHNAAEWRVDAKTGETTFTWLTKPDAEE
jgi:hypothetical protein